MRTSKVRTQPLGKIKTLRVVEVFDEREVRALLRGDAVSVEHAIGLVSRHLRDGVCGWIRRRYPALSTDDLADVWQDTLLAVLQSIRQGRLESDRPLAPWLATVAWRRAADLRRRRSSESRALTAVGEALERAGWSQVSGEDERALLEDVLERIATLPRRQRIVLRAFSDGYPETASMETLRRQASESCGEDLSLAAVKRALQEGRRKLREMLDRRSSR